MDWVERMNAIPSRRYQLMGRGRNDNHRTETDVAIVGFGWVGATAKELTEAGSQRGGAGARPDARYRPMALIRRWSMS